MELLTKMKVKLEMGKKWQVKSGIANLNTGRRKRCAGWNYKRKIESES